MEEQQSQVQSQTPIRRLSAGAVIAGKYKLLEKVGQGSFGFVYKTQNLKNGEMVATKFEKREDKKSISLLIREIKVLTEVAGIKGFPELQFYGRDEQYNFLMESYLGQNIEQLLSKCGGHFSFQTVLTMGIQMLDRIQGLHSKNLIHRDIKPENFTIGVTDPNIIYMIDFGLSKYYRDTMGKHIPIVGHKGLIGTARYASVNALLGNEQSRRDDLEAIGYMLVYLSQGNLPWMNLNSQNKEQKYQQILEMKRNFNSVKLFQRSPTVLFIYSQNKFLNEIEY